MAERSLVVTVGTPFDVELSGPAGAGYEWQAESLPAGIELLKREVRANPDAPIGGRATSVFQLRATRAGRTSLGFVLKRPWETNVTAREFVDVDAR
jgi:predicted secreted protein